MPSPSEQKKERKFLHDIHGNPLHTELTHAVASDKPLDTVRSILSDPRTEINWNKGFYGNTALHWAVANSHINMALFLLDEAKGLDVNTRDSTGKTALHLSIAKGFEHFTDSPQKNTDDPPQAPVITQLIDRTELKSADNNGYTALHLVMLRRDFAVVELILEKDISLFSLQNQNGERPLDMLTMTYFEAMNFISKYAAVFTISDHEWETRGNKIYNLFRTKYEQLQAANQLPADLVGLQFISKAELGGKTAIPEDTSDPAEEKQEFPILSEPYATLNQALVYSSNSLDNLRTHYSALAGIISALEQFKLGIEQLNDALKTPLQNDTITTSNAKIIANETLIFAQKVANLTVNANDITVFKKRTANCRTRFGKIIGTLIGAAIALAAAIITVVLAPEYAVMIALTGAAAALICAGIGFFSAKKSLEHRIATEQSLIELEHSANNVINAVGI